MNVTIDEDKCCGAGQCVLIAPDVFDQRDDDGIVILLDAQPPEVSTLRPVKPQPSAPPRPSTSATAHNQHPDSTDGPPGRPATGRPRPTNTVWPGS